jgi:hypothetical protein
MSSTALEKGYGNQEAIAKLGWATSYFGMAIDHAATA